MTVNRRHATAPVILDVRVVNGSGGGPDKTILNSPRFLADKGYRNLCAYMHAPDDIAFDQLRQKAAAWQAPLLSIPDRGRWDVRVLPRLLDVCRRERVDVWHGHDYKSNLLGLMLKRFWPMRLVTTVHGWVHHTSRTPLYYRIDRLCLPQYELVICVSPDLREECLKLGVTAERCVLIENGVCLDDFTSQVAKAEAKRRAGVPEGSLLVGAAGRLSAEKGFDVLIRSVARLIASGVDVHLWIAGEGDEERRLADLIRELGCGERIRLLGYRADLRDLYQAMDVYALSSLREGLPNVLLEAMAMQVPVVATRVAGVPRLVRHEVNGLLVAPGSKQELEDAMRRLLGNPELRDRLAQAGRGTIEADYSFAARMDKVRDHYDALLRCDAGMSSRSRRVRRLATAG